MTNYAAKPACIDNTYVYYIRITHCAIPENGVLQQPSGSFEDISTCGLVNESVPKVQKALRAMI